MSAVIRVISMAAAVAALSAACKSSVTEQPKREPTAAAPASANAPANQQPTSPGMCSEAEEPESCGCSHGHPKLAVDPAGRQVVPVSQAKVGDLTTCPVMNFVFEVLPDSPKLEVGGKTYYFCCEGCADKFKANPSRFITS